jgi:acyl-coenzyme A synthetase/AMP-(fatty) acid ligase
VKEKMIEWWGPVLHEYYAGTEGNGFVYTNSEDWLQHKGTVGKNLTGVLHILDEEGEEVPVGSEGTIYFESGASFSTTTTLTRPRVPGTRGAAAGARSATWASSTRTGSCT